MKFRKIIKVAYLRELQKAVNDGRITYARQCEILDHLAFYVYHDGSTKESTSIDREFNDMLYGANASSNA